MKRKSAPDEQEQHVYTRYATRLDEGTAGRITAAITVMQRRAAMRLHTATMRCAQSYPSVPVLNDEQSAIIEYWLRRVSDPAVLVYAPPKKIPPR
jgi:hypothetical protein